MLTYPIVLTNLAQMRVVVVGGGRVAERKVAGLLAGGAVPVVISPDLSPQLAIWQQEGRISWLERPYAEGDLAGAFLAFAATNNPDVNAQVAAEAHRCGILANIADAPAEGHFHTVATIRREDLLITVSTNGVNPARAAQLRQDIDQWLREQSPQIKT